MTRLICLMVFLTAFVVPALADDSPKPKRTNSPSAKQTALQIAYSKQRDLYAKYQAAERKAFKGSEVDQLRKASEDARSAFNKKIESLSVKERQAEKAARDALSAAIAKQVESSKEIAELKEKAQALQKQRRDLNFEIGLISVRLNHGDSPLQQELDSDQDLQKLREATYKGNREERSAAMKKYFSARKNKLAALKGAKSILAKIEQLQKQIAECDKEKYATFTAIGEVKRKIEYGKDASQQPLRDKLKAAQNATRKVYSHADAADQRAAADKARLAEYKKRKELTAGNKELTALQQQLSAVSIEIRELQSKSQSAPKKDASKKEKE